LDLDSLGSTSLRITCPSLHTKLQHVWAYRHHLFEENFTSLEAFLIL